MSRQRREENLRQMRVRLEEYARENGLDLARPTPPAAGRLAQSIFLAHSASERKFSDICESNRLRSPKRLDAEGIKPLRPDCVEAVLGTANFVFFYAAPFCFPHTGCGLLFSHRLESDHREEGAATAFDSGGLVHQFKRPDPAEAPAAFLARHEWPLPEHRQYLQEALRLLFADPLDYLRGRPPRWPGPTGLTGGDPRRRWTHEVRLPDQVFVRTGQLEAVFVPVSRVANPHIQRLLRWCEDQGVDYVRFPASRKNDFETLRRECIDYIKRRIL